MVTNDILAKPRGASHRAASTSLRRASHRHAAASPRHPNHDAASLAESEVVVGPKRQAERPWRSVLATPGPDDELFCDSAEIDWLMGEYGLTAEEVRDLRWQGLL